MHYKTHSSSLKFLSNNNPKNINRYKVKKMPNHLNINDNGNNRSLQRAPQIISRSSSSLIGQQLANYLSENSQVGGWTNNEKQPNMAKRDKINKTVYQCYNTNQSSDTDKNDDILGLDPTFRTPQLNFKNYSVKQIKYIPEENYDDLSKRSCSPNTQVYHQMGDQAQNSNQANLFLEEIKSHYQQIQDLFNAENSNLKSHNQYLIRTIKKLQSNQKYYQAQIRRYSLKVQQLERENDYYKERTEQLEEFIKLFEKQSTKNLSKPQEPLYLSTPMPKSAQQPVSLPFTDSDQIHNIKEEGLQKQIQTLNIEFQEAMNRYKSDQNPLGRKQCINIAKQIKQLKSMHQKLNIEGGNPENRKKRQGIWKSYKK